VAAFGGLALTVGCPMDGIVPNGGVLVYRRSGRGRHVSNAAKKKNANVLYATMQAAANDLTHPGDNSKVVQVVISQQLFDQLFGDGSVRADLRRKV